MRPESGHHSSGARSPTAESGSRRQRFRFGIGDKINVRVVAVPVGETELRRTFKIRFQTQRGKNGVETLAPEDAAFAKLMFTRLLRIRVAPDFAGERLHFGVALRKILQARRTRRRRADDRRPGLHQFADFFQHLGPHRRRLRQHQQPVAHAVRQHQPAILHRQPVLDHVGVDPIIVKSRRQVPAVADRPFWARPR